MCSAITLQPGETKELSFLLSWYFPHHISPKGHTVGHQYENWFSNSGEVCSFLAENHQSIFPKAKEFSQLLGETDAPAAFPRGWTAHLNTLLKCSWWTKNGDFGIWEGFGSCGFHTTDITYHGSWGLLALFPELQLRQMRMGAKFQRKDGRVHHFFTPDFSAVDKGFDRVDMNPQFVLMVCRDYLWTGDRQYLDELWPHVVLAMENTAQLDSDGDGLPDTDTKANTYDAWKFQGTPAYIASLWLGALTAGIRLAAEMGHGGPLGTELGQDLIQYGQAPGNGDPVPGNLGPQELGLQDAPLSGPVRVHGAQLIGQLQGPLPIPDPLTVLPPQEQNFRRGRRPGSGQPLQPAAQGVEPPLGQGLPPRRLHGALQPLPVPAGHGILCRLGFVRRTQVEIRGLLQQLPALGRLELGEEEIAEQAVAAVEVTAAGDAQDEQILPLQVGELPRRVVNARQGVAHVRAQVVQHGGAGEEVLQVKGQLAEQLVHEVVLQKALLTGLLNLLFRHGDLPLAEIAAQVGFQNYSTFYNTFKRLAGRSPENYAQEVRRLGGGQESAV